MVQCPPFGAPLPQPLLVRVQAAWGPRWLCQTLLSAVAVALFKRAQLTNIQACKADLLGKWPFASDKVRPRLPYHGSSLGADLEPQGTVTWLCCQTRAWLGFPALTAGVGQGGGGWWWGGRLLCSSPLLFSRSVTPGTSTWPGNGEHLVLLAQVPLQSPFRGLGLSPSTSEPWEGLCFPQMKRRKDSPGSSHPGPSQNGSTIRELVSCPTGHRDAFPDPTVFLGNALSACVLGGRAEYCCPVFGER